MWALGWRKATFEALDSAIAEDRYRYRGREDQPYAERYGKKYGWIGFFTYAGVLDERNLLPRGSGSFSDVDIDPSFPERAPTDGSESVSASWLLPSVGSHETWIRSASTSMPHSLLYRGTIGGHDGPWLAVHGFVKAEDRVLGREAWAFLSALVTRKKSGKEMASALLKGTQPWRARDLPSDHYVFAGEIPWSPRFASLALAEDAYRETVVVGDNDIEVEVLAHKYAWETYHNDVNLAGIG